MFEDGDPGFVPEAFAHEDGGVCGEGEEGRGDELRGVEAAHEGVGAALEVELEGGVEGFEHDGVVGESELVDALDPDVVLPSSGFGDEFVERVVAVFGGDVFSSQVFGFEGGEDPDEDGGDVEGFALGAGAFDEFVEFVVELGEGWAGELSGGAVELEVESSSTEGVAGRANMGSEAKTAVSTTVLSTHAVIVLIAM